MDNYKITCCSTVDMSREWMETNQIPFAMFHYRLNGKEYPERKIIVVDSLSVSSGYGMLVKENQKQLK